MTTRTIFSHIIIQVLDQLRLEYAPEKCKESVFGAQIL